jgi:hypothetical protein
MKIADGRALRSVSQVSEVSLKLPRIHTGVLQYARDLTRDVTVEVF